LIYDGPPITHEPRNLQEFCSIVTKRYPGFTAFTKSLTRTVCEPFMSGRIPEKLLFEIQNEENMEEFKKTTSLVDWCRPVTTAPPKKKPRHT
jgi:hypothetical protein